MTESVPHRLIFVEGPIGVGKTSLARRLAWTLGGETLLERPEENPFLARFYDRPREAALPAQLFFLFQRAGQLADLEQESLFTPLRVADFMLEKDRLFAELTLQPEERRLYESVYERVAPTPPVPDLVIYLQAPVDVLQQRVARRDVDYERPGIDEEYLRRINEAYMRFFHDFTAAPLLIVNAAEVNLAEGERAYQLLLEQIRTIRAGRHYFNPSPEML